VIVAEKVQDAVHDEVRDVIVQALALRLGLPRHRLKGERNVAEMLDTFGVLGAGSREGQDVGGPVKAAPRAVQLADTRIVREQEIHFDRGAGRIRGDRKGGRDGLPGKGLQIGDAGPVAGTAHDVEVDHGVPPAGARLAAS
jgi:hypothetical protein